MNRNREPSRGRMRRYVVTTGVALLVGAGLVVADTLTRPLEVHLRTHIEIHQANEEGDWEKIDEVGPATARFDANLLEMAQGKKIGTGYVFQQTSRAGKEYSARLAEDAEVRLNPATGKFDADVAFLVSYDGKSARVLARPTTETRFGPAGAARGRRADGVLGRGPVTVTLVSVNELQLDGEKPMMLVTEETYRMIPGPEEGRRGR